MLTSAYAHLNFECIKKESSSKKIKKVSYVTLQLYVVCVSNVDDPSHFAALLNWPKHRCMHSSVRIIAPHFHSSRRSISYHHKFKANSRNLEGSLVFHLHPILQKRNPTIFIISPTLQSELSPLFLFSQKWQKTQIEFLSLELLVSLSLSLSLSNLHQPTVFGFFFLIFNF